MLGCDAWGRRTRDAVGCPIAHAHAVRFGLLFVITASAGCPGLPDVVAPSPPRPAGHADVLAPKYAKASGDKIASLDAQIWPPRPVAVQSTDSGKGGASAEGQWTAWERPWLHKLEGAPPTFYTTAVRPDLKRATQVQVVALDARQLELDMAIGVEGPFPPNEKALGRWPRNGGKLPREANVATRVVAAFNGGFRFDQGPWGMSIRRREFMPPVKDVASLLMHDDGRLGFGNWGPEMKTPADVRSLRQNLDPLLDDGEVNPRKRKGWGGIRSTGKQVGQRAKRSGICRSIDGSLMYLWGDELEASDLGDAMKKVGCDFGMHLDMNIWHVGFVFMSFDDAQYTKGNSEAPSLSMGVGHKRYVHQPNPKEFFYASLRPPFVGPPSSAGVAFAPDGQIQPPPAWLPAILTKTEGGTRTTFVEARRVRFAFTVGYDELDGTGKRLLETKAPQPLAADDGNRVLASLRLGVASRANPLGLMIDSVAVTRTSAGAATLSIDDRGALTIFPPGELPSSSKWSAQLPAVVLDGKAIEAPPANLRMAFGVTPKGDLIVVEKVDPQATSAIVIDALIQAGCTRGVAPRDVSGGKLERMGRDEIAVGGADSRLFVLAVPPSPSTYRFDLDEHGGRRWPKVGTAIP